MKRVLLSSWFIALVVFVVATAVSWHTAVDTAAVCAVAVLLPVLARFVNYVFAECVPVARKLGVDINRRLVTDAMIAELIALTSSLVAFISAWLCISVPIAVGALMTSLTMVSLLMFNLMNLVNTIHELAEEKL